MSGIENIKKTLEGTVEFELLSEMEQAYIKIEQEQKIWYENSKFTCPDGCGCCCHNFEPDLMKIEALYMAAWLIENKPETAMQVEKEIYPFENGKTCPFYNPDNGYHCSIYGGRPFICRLFGASGSRTKTREIVWKPCKFYPIENLQQHNPPLAHRQYNEEETKKIFGMLPPVMSDLIEQPASASKDYENTKLIRETLPETIRKLRWIRSLQQNGE